MSNVYPHRQPVIKVDMTFPMDELLQQALATLTAFAETHCGPSTQLVKRTKPRILKIGVRQVIVEEICWSVSIEYMTEYNPDGHVDVCPCAILDLQQIPMANIWILLTDSEQYAVRIMTEIKIPGFAKTGLITVREDVIPVQSDRLLAVLNNFIHQGLLTKGGNRLDYHAIA